MGSKKNSILSAVRRAKNDKFYINEPSSTVRGVNRPIPPGYSSHPGDASPIDEARTLTTQERAEIQTFPSSFRFVGSKTNSEQMVGNAVPVRLAQHVAQGIAAALLLS